MRQHPRLLLAVAVSAAIALLPSRAWAQAFTPPAGVGSVTFAWQVVDNTGHRLSDGFYVERGQSVSMSALAEIEYGVTDRLSVSFGVPYVGAKYTGALPSFSGLPADECRCWHSSWQDIGAGARYRLGNASWAVTPLVRVGLPSHDYPYQGEAVVGRNLRELQVGVGAGMRFARLPSLSVQTVYVYSFVEKALDDVSVNRSNAAFDAGYALGRRFYVRGTTTWQLTHGGLKGGSVTGNPFPFPGELNTPERYAQRDRVISVKYWQAGGGVSYSAGPLDMFASYAKYVWGRDAHNGHVYNVGVTFYFDVGRGTATFDSRRARQEGHGPQRIP